MIIKIKDNFREILEPYIAEGIVECISWDKDYDIPKDWWRVQRSAYIDAIQRATGIRIQMNLLSLLKIRI